jgi:hypothetical protein
MAINLYMKYSLYITTPSVVDTKLNTYATQFPFFPARILVAVLAMTSQNKGKLPVSRKTPEKGRRHIKGALLQRGF